MRQNLIITITEKRKFTFPLFYFCVVRVRYLFVFFLLAWSVYKAQHEHPHITPKDSLHAPHHDSLHHTSTKHLALEIPATHLGDHIVHHLGYSLLYNEKHEQADWVAYELTREETNKSFGRTNKFLPDPMVITGSAVDADYKNSGYDRGHLAPAADMGWSEQSMAESFFFSNMSPQVPSFNRGIWKKLEEQVREWAREYDSLYIVTGPVLHDGLPYIGENKVSVPEMYYKIIFDHTLPEKKAIGFLIPNAASKDSLQPFACTIDTIELKTGIDFFPLLPDEEEQRLESSVCMECWKWKIQKKKKK